VLHVGFGGAPIPGIPQPIAAHRLRQGPFDSGALLLRLRACLPADPCLRCLHRLGLRTWWQAQAPALLLRPGAERPRGTRLAVFQRKLDPKRPPACRPVGLPPSRGPCALRAPPARLGPIHRKLVDGIAAFHLRLPPLERPRRTTQGDPVLLLTLDQSCSVARGRLDQVLARWQRFLAEGPVDRGGTLGLVYRSGGRVDRRNEVRGRGLACCTEVYHRARPRRVALMTVPRLGIIRRFDALGRPGQCTVGLEPYARTRAFPRRRTWGLRPCVVPLPDPAQGGAAGERPDGLGGLRGIDGSQHAEAILTDGLRVGVTRAFGAGPAGVLAPLPIALIPCDGCERVQPLGCHRGQGMQRGPERLGHPCQPTEDPNGRQDTRGVRALLPPRLEESQCATPLQSRLS
jgi:hypothetical protein